MKIVEIGMMCVMFLTGVQAAFSEEARSPNGIMVSSAAPAGAPPTELIEGYRGTVIPVAGDQLLYLKKGDRVDLLVTFGAVMGKKDGQKKETVTATILQNARILNVRPPDKVDGIGAVELLCNPSEAQYAALSVAHGDKINLILRVPGDDELRPMEIASFRRLIK